ncbi:hypothetical protein [Sphingomonas profundi]|uniref:hypothetical protein n=1 Tax=Alterirhizorhabdus profundi TaxID=2681549 RepID=UPI0012E86AA7|nr:hypothetical protein [Sphingomonas profundi]
MIARLFIPSLDSTPRDFEFRVSPVVGDVIHIEHEDEAIVVSVERIEHYPVAMTGGTNIFGGREPALTVIARVVSGEG